MGQEHVDAAVTQGRAEQFDEARVAEHEPLLTLVQGCDDGAAFSIDPT